MTIADETLEVRRHTDGRYREVAGMTFERDGRWYASLRLGNVVRCIEAGPDRDCAEAVLQLMTEGKR